MGITAPVHQQILKLKLPLFDIYQLRNLFFNFHGIFFSLKMKNILMNLELADQIDLLYSSTSNEMSFYICCLATRYAFSIIITDKLYVHLQQVWSYVTCIKGETTKTYFTTSGQWLVCYFILLWVKPGLCD